MQPSIAPNPRPESSAPADPPASASPEPAGPSRRHALVAGVGVAGVAVAGGVLAACSSSKVNGPANSTPPASPSTTATATGGAPAAPIAKLDDITVGGAVSAKLADGSPVIVARPTSTTAACFSAICTHQGCTVAPKSTLIQCPCHGSQYDLTTGQVKRGPAPRALPPVAVTVENGEVVPAT